MHACLWGKYLNKLEKLLSWSQISLNCSITTTAYSVTMTAMIYIVCHGKQTLELLFSDNFFSRYLKKMQNISVALSLSILHTYFFRMIILWGEHVYLVRSGGAQITWCTTFSWTFCKEHGLSCTRQSNLSSREYFWQGKISVCKVLVLIEVVPVKNDYFFDAKFGLHDILSFCIDAVLLEKIWRIY